MRASGHRWMGLGLALLLAACTGKLAPTGTAGKRPNTPPPALLAVTTLTGKVKIISDNGGGIISDNGGSIISDNGGGIISDNGGGIISNNSGAIIANNGGSIVANNGGGLVSNNGGGLTSKVKRQVLAAPNLAEYALADADVTFVDAAGKPALDEHGKVLTAHTDAHGTYKLTAKLPPGNLVAKVKLHDGGVLHGGELGAMLARGSKALQIDTSTTLGAAYVLGKYVHGDQATFDKLPGAEADQLHDELQDTRGYLLRPPSYQPDQMVAITEAIRGKVPTVDKRLDEIKALLLGQKNLGQGRAASTVALAGPQGLAVGKDGTFYVGENFFGRIRAVGQDGRISNFADGTRGKIKANYPNLYALALGPDGSMYVTSTGHVFRIGADGQQASVAGEGGQLNPRGVAVAADGTVYFGEDRNEETGTHPKIFAIPPGGVPKELPINDGWQGGAIGAMAVYPNGDLAFTYVNVAGRPCNLYRYHVADGRLEALIPGISFRKDPSGLVIAPDGTLYVTESQRIAKIDPAGQLSVVAGDGAPAGLADIGVPADLAIAPDGGLLFVDAVNALVREVTPDGKLAIRAGTTSAVQGDGFDSLALNVPQGAGFDDLGRVVVAEGAAQRVVRFDGKTLEQIAGGERGFAGDGGPAKDAQFNGPQEIATDGPDVYVMDIYNHRLRHIDGAGVIDSVAGTYDGVGEMTVGERRKANQVPIDPTGLTVDPQHRPLWCTRHGQIQRLAADGMVEWVAGLTGSGGTGGLDDIVGLIGSSGDQPVDQVKLLIPRGLRVGPDGAIYVAEFGGLRIARIADGKVSTFAGLPRAAAIAALGDPSRAEDGLKATAAALAFPGDLCFDKAGNMYVTEIGTTGLSLFTALGGEGLSLGDALPPAPPRVRRIAPDGTITTICGKGGKFFPDPDAEDALVLPTGLAIAPDGRMVIVDTGANQIIILPAGSY